MHRTTRAGASVTFGTSLRAVAIVARKRARNGQAKVYIDGAYMSRRSTCIGHRRSRRSWSSTSRAPSGVHTVKVVCRRHRGPARRRYRRLRDPALGGGGGGGGAAVGRHRIRGQQHGTSSLRLVSMIRISTDTFVKKVASSAAMSNSRRYSPACNGRSRRSRPARRHRSAPRRDADRLAIDDIESIERDADPGRRHPTFRVEDVGADRRAGRSGRSATERYPPRMGTLKIEVGDLQFTARWEAAAPGRRRPSVGCCRSSRRSSTAAGRVSRPGSRWGTSGRGSTTRTTPRILRPATWRSTPAGSASARSSSRRVAA